ncbi:MAG: hypothetical protein ACKOEM_13330 [Planctomycetia bacterium]
MPKKREKPTPILSVLTAGTPEHPRFVIADQYLRYWTGERGWSEQQDLPAARLFATTQEALQMIHTLLVIRHCDLPKKTYTVPVTIELYSPEQVSERDLQQWLMRVSKLILDTPRHGNGPVAGSYGSVRIDFSQLKEAT